MTQSELKSKLYDLVFEYFGTATILWGKVKAVNPNVPQVVLNMGAVRRHYHPIVQVVEGVLVNCYPSKTTLQIDLYTKGAPIGTAPGVAGVYENTAVDDLTDFMNFLQSEYVNQWGDLHDIAIHCRQIHDLTELLNDVAWEYRAMIELEIGFTQSAVGHTGTMFEKGTPYYENGRPKIDAEGNPLDPEGEPIPPELDEAGNPIPWEPPQFLPTPSGGRTQVLADQHTGWFEEVDGPNYKEKRRN